MDQTLRAVVRTKQRLAQRCSINVGSSVLSFIPSFIHSFSPRRQRHLYNLDFGGDPHGVSPCSSKGLSSSSAQVPFLGPSAAWVGIHLPFQSLQELRR